MNYETREGTVEIARLFFAWLALFFDFPTILEPGTGHKKSDEIKELWGFTIKKLSLSLVLFMLLKFISFSMSFR